MQRSVSSLCSLETIAEEPVLGPGPPPQPATPPRPAQGGPWCTMGPAAQAERPRAVPLQLRTGSQGDTGLAPHSRWQACHGGGPSGACEGAPGSQTDSRGHPRALGHLPLVRRAKSEGQVPSEPLSGRRSLAGPSPALYSDATAGDRLWQRLEPGSHRDSVSSSSSLSSGDTVIDLSLPGLGLGRESLLGAPAGRLPLRPCSASAARLDFLSVTKSKSNPNLRAAGQFPAAPDELRPRPLAPQARLPMAGLRDGPTSTKSKSLGDLTADDFAPRVEGPGRSLGHSLGPAREGPAGRAAQRDPLTEQLLWLTGFQQAGDITSPTSLGPAGEGAASGPGFQRRSSRSQSRVRAIASRARQAQERQQRLQGPRGLPEEERGAPEGACSAGQEGCGDLPAPKGAAGLLRL